jgi:hypothetical protein
MHYILIIIPKSLNIYSHSEVIRSWCRRNRSILMVWGMLLIKPSLLLCQSEIHSEHPIFTNESLETDTYQYNYYIVT